ncbi:MAG: hypothetical protein LBH22_06420 [Bacteroidales bacterium]|jgi:hypothetical protein|nr:hypothetical protein [Bacteroidales bacterium]
MENPTRTFDENEAQASPSAETNNTNSVKEQTQTPKKDNSAAKSTAAGVGAGIGSGIGTNLFAQARHSKESPEDVPIDVDPGEDETSEDVTPAKTVIINKTVYENAPTPVDDIIDDNLVAVITDNETDNEIVDVIAEQPTDGIIVDDPIFVQTYDVTLNTAHDVIIPQGNYFPENPIEASSDVYYAENTDNVSSGDFPV